MLIDFQNLTIVAKPEFISISKSSQSISTLKRKSHFLVWVLKEDKDQLMVINLKKKRNKLLIIQYYLKWAWFALR